MEVLENIAISFTVIGLYNFFKMENKLVPIQQTGSEVDIQSETVLASMEEAKYLFALAKLRLEDVNNWERTCETSATNFQLTQEDGTPSFRLAVGNLIRIDIPGPGTITGKGYDWVRIEQIGKNEEGETEEWFGFRVRPSSSPVNSDEAIAHFFSKSSTSTFIVRRVENRVIAEMHGRNETPNSSNDTLIDGIRNTIVGWSAKMGLSYPQWKFLMDGLVKKQI